jgi:hypothetical protein
MIMDNDNQGHAVQDDSLLPTADTTSVNAQSLPVMPQGNIPVPQDMVNAGHPTNEPRDDSPESLDEEITQGANREDIDPDHSYDRPAGVNSIDPVENGAD